MKTTIYDKKGKIKEIRDSTPSEIGELILARAQAKTFLRKLDK